MPTLHYLAIAEQAPGEAAWSIEFREFPEVCASAADRASLPDQAHDALLTVIDAYVADRRTIPEPLRDPPQGAVADGGERIVLLLPVDVPVVAVRVNISIDRALLARIDAAAEHLGMTRSGLLAESARRMISAEMGKRVPELSGRR
jgi:predicted RNase H-like HicB family nuclease